jgi:hypothetical protein
LKALAIEISTQIEEQQPIPESKQTRGQQPLEAVNDLQITPKTVERTVTLTMCRSIFLKPLIALQLILTLICGAITVYSRRVKLTNGKIVLLVVFRFSALILYYTYQAFSAIQKKSDNFDALTCSLLFIDFLYSLKLLLFVVRNESFNHFDY